MQHEPPVWQGFLAQHGAALIDQGYNIVPIQPGKKAPGFDGWQKGTASKPQLKEWLANGHKHAGVGINTRDTPAIDIDVYDSEVADAMEQVISDLIGPAPVRVGRQPKRLMLFRADTPFRKMRSCKWKDDFGAINFIEVLADGQQCVAYHKHPDTGKPYVWTHEGQNPLVIPARELISVTPEQCQEVIDDFEHRARNAGWLQVKGAHSYTTTEPDDNPWIEDTNAINIEPEELRKKLLLVTNPEDYDEWTKIGMALHHQFDGEDDGLALWHEWSETANNYDNDALERHWKSFAIEGKKRAPITARYILKRAAEATAYAREQLTQELQKQFREAKTLTDWKAACAATCVAEIDGVSRARLAALAKDRNDTLAGMTISLSVAKRAIAYKPKTIERIPHWCEGWVYDGTADRFYSTKGKISRTKQGFDAMYDREALTKKDILDDRTEPSHTASYLALNQYKIDNVNGCRYMPGEVELCHYRGHMYANLYNEYDIPEIPDPLSKRDQHNVALVKAHLSHLLDETDARMFLDWISWVVQHPGQFCRYAVLLQGVEGDGKSFWGEMLRAIMGSANVTTMNAHILHSDFTDWTVGQCLTYIEEVRLINDSNKYEVLNRIKPILTNPTIQVHPKGKAPYNAPNTTNYLIFSNYKDALPIDDNSRRYLVLFSKWQSRRAIMAFKKAHPAYYTRLYATFEESPGALRHWLLNHQQQPEFDPKGDAPDTAAKSFMAYLAKPDCIQAMELAITNGDSHLVGPDIVTSNGLHEIAMSRSIEFPTGKKLTSMLNRDGYESLGHIRVEGEVVTVWAREADTFRGTDFKGRHYVVIEKVLAIIEQRKADLKSDAL
jgi:hypothetical protein